jgi:hypothetical protein
VVRVHRAAGRTQGLALEAHDETVAALEAAGYELDEGSWYEHMLAPLDDQLARPVVPDGYELRTVRGDEDVEARVEVHRAAFAPRGSSPRATGGS